MNAPQRDPGEPGGLAQVDGTSGGADGARLRVTETFHGRDPETVAAPAICRVTPTKCQARTRLYRGGQLELEGFPVSDISDYIDDPAVTVWLDLRGPDNEDLAVLSDEFGLHPSVTFVVALLPRLHIALGVTEELEESPEQLGMPAAVVAFTVVLHDRFPIAVLDEIDPVRDLASVETVRREIGLDDSPHVVEIAGRLIGQADE